jgi:hypothetical protein
MIKIMFAGKSRHISWLVFILERKKGMGRDRPSRVNQDLGKHRLELAVPAGFLKPFNFRRLTSNYFTAIQDSIQALPRRRHLFWLKS